MAVYVGSTTSSPPAGVSSSPRSSARARSGSTSTASSSRPPYVNRSASSAARAPLATTRSSPVRSGSKSTSQIHETSRPSAISSFSATTTVLGGRPSTRVRTTSFAPAGFLTSSSSSCLPSTGIRSKRPNAALKRSEAVCDLVERGAESAGERRRPPRRCRRCRGRAAAARRGAIPPASRARTPPLPGRGARRHGRRRRAAAARGRSSDSGSRRDARRRPRHTRTAYRSGCSTSSRPHAGATARASRGSSSPNTVTGSLGVGESGELRVVAVDDEARPGRKAGHRGAPALGDELELAVAVELVAKQVAEADDPRTQAPDELRQRRLVHLEEAELGSVGGEQRRCHAGDEVRAGGVVGEPQARPEDLRGHRRRRRLAVRRGDDGRPGGQPGGETVDRVRIEPGEQLPRNRRASAGAHEPRQAGDGTCGGDLGGERHGQAHVARVREQGPRPRLRAARGMLRTGDARPPRRSYRAPMARRPSRSLRRRLPLRGRARARA